MYSKIHLLMPRYTAYKIFFFKFYFFFNLGKTVLPAVYKVVINPDKQADQIMNAQSSNLLINQIKEIGKKYAVKDNEMAESFIMKTRKGTCKVGCVFPMVISSEFRTGEFRDDDHREYAPLLI